MRRFSGHRRRCHWPGRHSPSLDAGVPRLSPASSLDSACGLTSCVRSLGESRLLGTARGAATLGVTRSGPQHSDGNLQTLSPFVTSLICQMGLCRSAGQFRTAARARGSPIPGVRAPWECGPWECGPVPGHAESVPGCTSSVHRCVGPVPGVRAPGESRPCSVAEGPGCLRTTRGVQACPEDRAASRPAPESACSRGKGVREVRGPGGRTLWGPALRTLCSGQAR